MTEVYQSIQMTIILMIIAILLSILFFYIIIRRLLKPMGNLLKVADNISSGNLADRAVIFRNDEIGRLSGAFNEMAENLYDLINNLEDTVKTRTEDMKTSKDQLRLLLDSAAEAIYGIDLEGNCTFCNTSCIKLLGYSGQEDLLGENMHRKIHHSKIDGTPFSAEECKIMKSIRQNEGTHSDDEVFWKEDGTFFYVEYHAYPQIKNEKIVGAVITFTDITGRRKREAEIKYLSCHDTLTGLHNRRCFEENLKKLDNPDNLPLSVIFADINGLKMTNDIFGHSAGDALIKKSSEILMEACRKDGSVARVGGDEFVMILPKATNEDAMKVLSNIKDIFSDSRIAAIKCSIALGSNTKTNSAQPIEEVLSSAENAMYKDKALNRKSFNMDIINTIIETLHNRSPKEKQHSITVEEICGSIGSAMDLPDTEIKRLKQAGFLHDIGKIVLEEHLLSKADLSEEELEKMQQHPVIGYRILNLFDTTLDLSEGVYSHHERWDGKGYPKGLKGREIPLLSRIISIGETYERVLSSEENPNSAGREKAIQVIIDGAGKQFDPQIVDLFVQMMNKQ